MENKKVYQQKKQTLQDELKVKMFPIRANAPHASADVQLKYQKSSESG
jgi:hypothetical protein